VVQACRRLERSSASDRTTGDDRSVGGSGDKSHSSLRTNSHGCATRLLRSRQKSALPGRCRQEASAFFGDGAYGATSGQSLNSEYTTDARRAEPVTQKAGENGNQFSSSARAPFLPCQHIFRRACVAGLRGLSGVHEGRTFHPRCSAR
jgi:hypothetical protein